jgi:branched-chain amino acid transport system ATP-binding protein
MANPAGALAHADAVPPLLALENLTVSFGGVHAVDHVSFSVPNGSIVSLIGPNGAGKTTALNAISGFVPASGSVRCGGLELLGLPAHRRARLGIGRTFQNLQLFTGLTLLDNVLIGQHVSLGGNVLLDALRLPVLRRERAAATRAWEILASLGIEVYAARNVEGLPFGVQKLAGVARALALNPKLLLLDEPAAGLTHAEVVAFGTVIEALRRDRGLTILLVEHNMRLVMNISDRIVVLDQGRRLMEGTPEEVRASTAVIEAYLGSANREIVEEVRHELA